MNVLEGVMENKYFLAIMGVEFVMQVFMVQMPGINMAMGCAGMNMSQWMFCIAVVRPTF